MSSSITSIRNISLFLRHFIACCVLMHSIIDNTTLGLDLMDRHSFQLPLRTAPKAWSRVSCKMFRYCLYTA